MTPSTTLPEVELSSFTESTPTMPESLGPLPRSSSTRSESLVPSPRPTVSPELSISSTAVKSGPREWCESTSTFIVTCTDK
jgi:hypothetical protein